MEASGLYEHLNNPMLMQELIEKLPSQMRLDWAKFQMNVQSRNLKTFSDWLFELAEAASTVSSLSCFTEGRDSEKRKSQRVAFHKMENQNSEKSNFGRSTPRLACYFCGKEHMLVKCEKFKQLSYSDRWGKIQELKVCNSCLKAHDSKFCKERKECQVNGCTKKHHPLLHKPDEAKPANEDAAVLAVQHQDTSNVLYRVLPITIYGNGNSCDLYAFLDDGSGPTLIEEGVVKQLGLSGVKRDLCLKWTDGTVRIEQDSESFNVKISGQGNVERQFPLNDVRSVKSLDLPAQTVNYAELEAKYKHLRGLPVKSYQDKIPRMIIGLNNKSVAMPLKYR